jgi:hypothetical protein
MKRLRHLLLGLGARARIGQREPERDDVGGADEIPGLVADGVVEIDGKGRIAGLELGQIGCCNGRCQVPDLSERNSVIDPSSARSHAERRAPRRIDANNTSSSGS